MSEVSYQKRLQADSAVKAATTKLVALIKNYESDTFSASGSRLTRNEARHVAARLICQIEDRLDGVSITGWLDEVRGR